MGYHRYLVDISFKRTKRLSSSSSEGVQIRHPAEFTEAGAINCRMRNVVLDNPLNLANTWTWTFR